MTQFSDFGENQMADKMRGTEPSYPTTNWFVAFASAASDSSFTEITGADLPRVAVARTLLKWAGTQGPGSTLASSGTSHTTSNNDIIQFGTAASNRGTATHVGLFDALTGGNNWIWLKLPSPIVINSGSAPSLAPGIVQMSIGLLGGMTDYLANKMVDEIWRGQAYPWPATTYDALFSVAPTNAGGGTELSGGAYARFAIASSMAAMSGTQGAGSTSASSGTSGRTANNAAEIFPNPTADATVLGHGKFDAASAGNLLFGKATASKSISAGGSPATFPTNTVGYTFD